MKTNISLTLILFCLVFSLPAQTIPNQGFEEWTNFGGWHDTPNDWQTNNHQIFAPIIKDTDAYEGQYALRANSLGIAKSKFVFKMHPYSINFYAKSAIVLGDSVIVKVFAYFNNNLVDSGIWVNKIPIPNWTPQTIFISQNLSLADSLEIQIKGGAQSGTHLSVDNFNFKALGIEENDILSDWKLFPIPISNYATLKFNNLKKLPHTLTIYNLSGDLVTKIDETREDKVIIEKNNLPRGMYFFQLQSKGHIISKGNFLIE